MILEPPKIKSDTASTVSPSISHEVRYNQIDRNALRVFSLEKPEDNIKLAEGKILESCSGF